MSSGHTSPPSAFSNEVQMSDIPVEGKAHQVDPVAVPLSYAEAATAAMEVDAAAMEVDAPAPPPPTVKRVVVNITALNPEQRALVLADPKGLYADPSGYGLEDIFALRGKDRPDMRPGKMKGSYRLYCDVGIKDAHEQGSRFVGTSLVAKEEEKRAEGPPPKEKPSKALKAQLAVQAKLKKQQQEAAKAEAQRVKLRDSVKISFLPDSQTPNIEISTGKTYSEKGAMSTRIWASDIQRDPQNKKPLMWLDLNPSSASLESVSKNPGNASTEGLKALAKEQKLIAIKFQLTKGSEHRHWAGIPHKEVHDIRQRAYDISAQEETLTRDLLVSLLDTATDADQDRVVSIFLDVTPDQKEEWHKFFDYLYILFMLAGNLGNFWFFRSQLQMAGLSMDAIEDNDLPKITFETPIWTVRSFRFDETTTKDGKVLYTNHTPYSWDYLRAYEELPSPNEAAFMIKMGIIAEESRQKRDLSELVKSEGKMFFHGQFREMPGEQGLFVVLIHLACDSEIDEEAQDASRGHQDHHQDRSQGPVRSAIRAVSSLQWVSPAKLWRSRLRVCMLGTWTQQTLRQPPRHQHEVSCLPGLPRGPCALQARIECHHGYPVYSIGKETRRRRLEGTVSRG
jgi:hypothetical protein